MLNVLSLLCFVGFLLAALLVAVSERAGTDVGRRRRAVSAFLLYGLGASFGAGLTQNDAWPFSKWPMAGGLADPTATNTRIVAVDAEGTERAIDYRAWQPLGFDELNPWIHRTYPRLPRPAQDRVAAYLLDLAERSRLRARSGEGVGYFDRFLGPLTAPYFDLHPKIWSGPAGAPPRPFVRLRVYRESWNQEERRRDPGRIERVLLHEYSQR